MPRFWKRRRADVASGPIPSTSPTPIASVEAEALDRTTDAVVLVAPDGTVQWLNLAARQIFAAPEDAAGRMLLEIVRDHRLAEAVRRAAETRVEELVEVNQPVSDRNLRARAVPLSAARGVALVVEDLTKVRHLETVRQQFVANLSHELRTPLAGLDLAAQTLSSQLPPGAEERVFVDRVLKEAQRLTAILGNLTQLAALDAERISVDRERFPVQALLEENAARYAVARRRPASGCGPSAPLSSRRGATAPRRIRRCRALSTTP